MDNDRIAEKVAHYSPDPAALATLRDVTIVLLTATSGTGKNAVIDRLVEKHPDTYRFLLSHTTRAPRVNNGILEQDGVNYHFIDFQQAEHLLDTKQYVEANWYAGNIYGLTVGEIVAAHKAGKVPINEVEVQGANNFAERVPSARTIFILPPDYDEWQRRLKKRYGSQQAAYAEDLHKRMQTAKFELENALQRDHYYLVINDSIDRAADEVHDIALGKVQNPRSPEALAVAERLLQRLNQECKA